MTMRCVTNSARQGGGQLPDVSVIVPAYNEQQRIGATLQAIRLAAGPDRLEIVVVDDGSFDGTIDEAAAYADRVLCHATNKGKGEALLSGYRAAKGRVIIFLDADLGESACHYGELLEPVACGACDMAIAALPAAARKGGFGLVKGLAVRGIYQLCGYRASAPLSGQRAMRREVLERIGKLSGGFGIEVGLTIDAVRSGFRVAEVGVPFRHRETGRDLPGFVHRARQFVSIGATLFHKWRRPLC